MKMENPIESAPSPISPRRRLNNSNSINIATKPTWLLSILADVEERMKMLALNTSQDEDNGGDTFAERAEAYYKRRPQLLSLLQDLYNAYLTLSDRYIQTIAKTHHHPSHSSDQISTIYSNEYYYYDRQEDGETSQIDSDIESSLSYQLPTSVLPKDNAWEKDDTMLLNFDAIVTEIVMNNVEYDILLHEASATERRYNESSRKTELQKSLLEVLESERLILLHENAKLGYKVGALMEENKALASESLFMRRKAGELGRCLLKMREDHRVCMLSRKIEDLQGQIYGLEKRNKEYYEQLVNRDQQEDEESSMDKKRNGNQVDLVVCFQMGKMNQRLKRSAGISNDHGKSMNGSRKKGSSWWGRVKNMDLFLCGLNPSFT